MFKKVLAAVDLSQDSAEIANRAIQVASCHGAKLLLLHVVSTEEELYLPYSLYPVMDGYSEFSETALGQYEARVKEHREQCLKELKAFQAKGMSQGVEVDILLETGEPGHSICDIASDQQSDLILLGHRGLRGLKEIVLGSVSNFVMHHAPCAVLILHDSAKSTDSSEPPLAEATTS